MKVLRRSMAAKKRATWKKRSALCVFSPSDFQESRRRRGISLCP
jgi:hypothetical protein